MYRYAVACEIPNPAPSRRMSGRSRNHARVKTALWVPIIHPCWSGSMPVLVEDAAEAVASFYMEEGGGAGLGDR